MKTKILGWAEKVVWVSRQFGFDPRLTLRALSNLPRYLRERRTFRTQYSGPFEEMPCLHDRDASSGGTDSEYFLQDLHVAQRIHARHPRRHIDVGSRVDGFVAHVASFRPIEVLDIRPSHVSASGIRFVQADVTGVDRGALPRCDSLSCLHALEHFGLGRYGDRLDAQGAWTGLLRLAEMLEPGGVLYLSVPVGMQRVVFNAHRVFDPRVLVERARHHGLELEELAYIARGRGLVPAARIAEELEILAAQRYALGIFTFRKP